MCPSEHVICDPHATCLVRRPTSGASRSPDRDDPCVPRAPTAAGQALGTESAGWNQHEITAERLRRLVLRGQRCGLGERATRSRGPVVHSQDVVDVGRALDLVHARSDPRRCETVRMCAMSNRESIRASSGLSRYARQHDDRLPSPSVRRARLLPPDHPEGDPC